MEELRNYLAVAKNTTRAEFVSQSDALFLIKRPSRRSSAGMVPSSISYATQLTRFEGDPYANEWRIAPVKKRPGNPYPDRISIGRALNCDVVLRLPTVSKVHAHILIEGPNSFTLRDNEASNSTFVNGRKLEAKASSKLQIGDEISLGALVLEFIDAKTRYQILKSEVGISK